MEIIIDEFSYPTHRSFLSRIKNLLKTLKRKSYFLVILLLTYVIFRRFSENIRMWIKIILGRKINLQNQKIIQNSETIKRNELWENFIEKSLKKQKVIEFSAYYHNQIIGMFSLEQLKENLTQNSHFADQRSALLESYKLEMLAFSCLWMFSKHIIELLLNIKDLLQVKYLEKFDKKYPNTISEAEKITDYITHEFYDNLIHAGLKNLAAHIKKVIFSNVSSFKAENEYSFENIVTLLNELEEKMLTFNSKDLNLPDDNRRRRNFSSFSTFNNKATSHKKITFTDFNVISTEINEIEEEDNESRINKSSSGPAILFPQLQGLAVPKNSLDLLSIFTGDITNHKYFIDQDLIEKYIITADHNARAERYRCELQEIKEVTDDEYDSEFISEDEILEGGISDKDSEISEQNCQVIEEARYYFSLILKLFCGEIVDFLESSNLNIYMFYAIKSEFFFLKRRLAPPMVDQKNEPLENWLNKVFDYMLGKSHHKDNIAMDSINFSKESYISALLKETRNQIFRTLAFSEHESNEICTNNIDKNEEKIGEKKILEYLLNYGASWSK